ncbi:MAG: SOS response-associated peptidase [Myxococcota bacterium]
MCGRFTLTTNDYQAVSEALEAELLAEADECRARYNVAPGDTHPIVWADSVDRRLMQPAQWGMPGVDDDRFHINARAETVHVKPAFRDALYGGRCLVAADGFYEWTGDAKQRLPIWFHRPDRALMVFAGLYRDVVDRKTGEVTRRFTILTTRPNDLVAPVHDRMPVILDAEAWQPWLAPPPADVHTWPGFFDRIRPLLSPLPEAALVGTEVSDRANRVAHDDPRCIAPFRHPKQQSLF